MSGVGRRGRSLRQDGEVKAPKPLASKSCDWSVARRKATSVRPVLVARRIEQSSAYASGGIKPEGPGGRRDRLHSWTGKWPGDKAPGRRRLPGAPQELRRTGPGLKRPIEGRV
jgi:hypothetical protein